MPSISVFTPTINRNRIPTAGRRHLKSTAIVINFGIQGFFATFAACKKFFGQVDNIISQETSLKDAWCDVKPMTIVLFDSEKRHDDLLPLSFTRPIAEFRVGILSIKEKWEWHSRCRCLTLAVDYLRLKFPLSPVEEAVFVAGWILPDKAFINAVKGLNAGHALSIGDELVAYRGTLAEFNTIQDAGTIPENTADYDGEVDMLTYVYDVFRLCHKGISEDYPLLTAGRKSQPLSPTNTVVGDYLLPDGQPAIFLEEGASVEGAIINVKNGPVFIAREGEVMEGACLRGPLSLGSHSKINMGAKIYGATAIGPWCKIGGEVNNSVFFGFSNKAHDGFVGNAVIGEWCNIGAGTNASNLKNDYSKIRLWNYARHTFMRTDLQFCGLIMGDHSKIGVNCMLNTATVMGVGVNLHGAGFPRPFIPSFLEGAPGTGFKDVPLKRFYDIAERVMSRRNAPITDADRVIFERVYEVASKFKQP